MIPAAPAGSSEPSLGLTPLVTGTPDAAIGTHDKHVLDRRARHRHTPSRRAVREAREQLHADEASQPRFAQELAAQHARALIGGRWFAVAVVAMAGMSLWPMVDPSARVLLVLWSVVTALVYVIAGEISRSRSDEGAGVRAGRTFVALHVALGTCWAGLVVADLGANTLGTFGWTLFGALVLALMLHTFLSGHLAFGVALVGGPPLAALAVRVSLDGSAEALTVFAYTLTATVLFALTAQRVHDNARTTIRSNAEKDVALLEAREAEALSDEARRRAEAANLAKTRFLATMSHELRTPLNAVIGFSEIMQSETFGPLGHEKYRDYLDDIHQSGSHLLKLINEILDLSRVEAGRYDMHEEAVDLSALAVEALQMIRPKADGKELTTRIFAERSLPRVFADERAVRQVLLNLLSNAVKFTPRGGEVTVKVGWTQGGGQYLTVCDTGPGIPEEEMRLVLSSFGQGSIALKVAEPGTGLGLPIVQAFMQMHDGKFELASQLRKGTQATASFPRRRVMADALPDAGAKRRRTAFAA